MNIKKKNLICLCGIMLTFSHLVFAQSQTSSESHEGKINKMYPFETYTYSDDSFYSAGADGFIVKWSSDGMGEHYQVTDMQVMDIARNPSTGDIAVYESDGVSVHKVVVMDSKNFQKKYSKSFKNSVTSFAFSEKGNLLIVSTAAVNGTYIYNARTGELRKKLTDVPAVISMIKTASSEKNAVFYSPSGSLIYYDLINMRQKQKFNTEASLEQTMIFGAGEMKNRFFVGVRENGVYIIDATNGKIVANYFGRQPYVFTGKNQFENGLFFITNDGKNYVLKQVTNDMLKAQLTSTNPNTLNPPAPYNVKTFTGLKNKDTFTSIIKNSHSIIMGTASGNIYTMTDVPEAETYTLFPMTEKMFEKIYDIDSDGKDFYLVTKDSVYKTSYDTKVVDRLSVTGGHSNVLKIGDSAILWSRGTRKNVIKTSLDHNSVQDVLFTPDANLSVVRSYGNKIIYIQGNSSVGLYDLEDGSNKEIYSGTSVQDAMLINEETLYVAKTSIGQTDSALIAVNINTHETVPVKITGNVVFSLSYDYTKNIMYGIMIRSTEKGNNTEVFSFSPDTKVVSYILRLTEEDAGAFTTLSHPHIFTNLGKNMVNDCNVETKKNVQYKRSASMPIKVQVAQNRVAVLNRNGSITWYNVGNMQMLADWYLNVNGDWMEY